MIDKKILKGFIAKKLSIVPLKKDKRPNINSWKRYQKDFINIEENAHLFESLGLVCGEVSGNLEVIDVDQKNEIYIEEEGHLIDQLKSKMELFSKGLYKKLTVAETINGGYHLIYKCEKICGNVKLASRDATKKEQKAGEKKVVLLETRGESGYIVTVPTEGYNIIQGSLSEIPTITKAERDTIFSCCRMFDETMPPVFMENPQVAYASTGLTPWEDYNSRGDWQSVMTKHGWTIKTQQGSKYPVKRPGSKSPVSGNFDTKYNLLRVFSTSSVFDSDKSYNPFSIYTILECGGDFKAAARQLSEMNYGRKPEAKFKRVDEPVELDDTHEFLVGKDVNSFIDDFATGKIPMGLSTGYDDLDNHYRFKPQAFDIIGGTAGLGKTTIACFLFALANALHGKRVIIYSTENPAWELKVFILEFLYGERVKDIPKAHRDLGLAYLDKQFAFIETEDMLSYLDVINMVDKIEKKEGSFDMLFIDPWNALKLDYTEVDRKLNTYQYTLQVTTRLQKWCKAKDMSLYVGMHSNTESARRVHQSGDLKDNPAPLNAADLADGVVWENKATHLLLVHRYKFVEELRNQTQIAVKKVKSKHTGGMETTLANPVLLNMGRGKHRDFFSFYDSKNESPLRGWFKKTILGKQSIEVIEPTIQEQVYEDNNEEPEENNSSQEYHDFNKGSVFKRSRTTEEDAHLEEESTEDAPPF